MGISVLDKLGGIIVERGFVASNTLFRVVTVFDDENLFSFGVKNRSCSSLSGS